MEASLETATNAPTPEARKAYAFALTCISGKQQASIAAIVGLSPATVSRFVSDDLSRACAILTAAGIKLVPADCSVYDARKVGNLLDLARDYLNQLEDVEQLRRD